MPTQPDDSGHLTGRVEGCEVCQLLERSGPDETVLESAHFSVLHTDSYPWGLVVCSTRHNEGLWTLPDTEAAEFGQVLVRVARAMRVEWTDRVYALTFGEDEEAQAAGRPERRPHFLMMLLTQSPSISTATHDAMAAEKERRTADSGAARALAARVRTHLTDRPQDEDVAT